jgi:YD repeat-containing protein
MPGGGSVVYPSSPQFSRITDLYPSTRALRSNSALAKIGAGTYRLTKPDGSALVYGRRTGGFGSYRFFLTAKVDAAGQQVTLSYDGSNRVVALVDALGQVTSFEYSLSADPLKITKITDPFGRFATFVYDASARLIKITDVVGIVSQFTYQGAGDFISALTTPYGTSTFAYGENGANARDRWLDYRQGGHRVVLTPQGRAYGFERRRDWDDDDN